MADTIEEIAIGNASSLVAADLRINFTNPSVTGNLSTLVGGIQVPVTNLTLSRSGGEITVSGATAAGTGVSVQFDGLNPLTATTTVSALGVPAVSLQETAAVVCFASGTHIRTDRGDVVVERLAIGDTVITVSGAYRAIRWIGHRVIDCGAIAKPHDAWPVCIRAGAFGGNLPEQDLRLSPGHPVLVGAGEDGAGGVLVPIMCLINGTSIAREPVENVTYWHVELEGSHDIVLAEGLAAESYLDWGNRPFFDEGSDHILHNPDFVIPGLDARCRPVAISGAIVEAERRRLDGLFAASLASMCAWPSSDVFQFGF